MNSVSWTHRFFWCQKRSGKWVCRFLIKSANFWLPRSFVWSGDEETLKVYIDALTEKNKTVTTLWEDKGTASDLVYEPEPEGGIVRLDPAKLMAFLRGEYVLEIPCSGRVIISDEGNNMKAFMPQEVQASLLATDGPLHELYVTRVRQMAAANIPILTDKNFTKGKATSAIAWNANCNLPKPDETAVEQPAQVKEQELTRVDHESHTETVCFCGDYFIKRLLAADKPFWAASSYNAKGPWQPFFCDQVIYDLVFQPEAANT